MITLRITIITIIITIIITHIKIKIMAIGWACLSFTWGDSFTITARGIISEKPFIKNSEISCQRGEIRLIILKSDGHACLFGRGDDTVGNPHRAQIVQCELFELVLLSKLDKQLPVEQFEATVSQSTVPSPVLSLLPSPLSLSRHIYLSISLHLSTSLYISLHLSLSLYIYIYMYTYTYIYMYMCMYM